MYKNFHVSFHYQLAANHSLKLGIKILSLTTDPINFQASPKKPIARALSMISFCHFCLKSRGGYYYDIYYTTTILSPPFPKIFDF